MESKQIKEMLTPIDDVEYSYGDEDSTGKVLVKNTFKIQYTSLLHFANSLGYMQDEMDLMDYRFGGSFLYKDGNHKRSVVSFKTMVEWHNRCFTPTRVTFSHGLHEVFSSVSEELGFSVEDMINAINSKLVKQVFFQATNKKDIIIQKHIVRFS